MGWVQSGEQEEKGREVVSVWLMPSILWQTWNARACYVSLYDKPEIAEDKTTLYKIDPLLVTLGFALRPDTHEKGT